MKFSELQLNANVLEALDAMRFDECIKRSCNGFSGDFKAVNCVIT